MLEFETIRRLTSGEIRIDEPLGNLTTFRVGGPADLYVEPLAAEEVVALVQYMREKDAPFIVLGNGSNVLVHDAGFRGVAISLERGFAKAELNEEIVTAGAGMRLASFVDFCIRHGLQGVERLAGIPGTVGGAVIMNAGAYGSEIKDHLLDVSLIRNDEHVVLTNEECGFSYRLSGLASHIILSARFRMPQGNIEEMKRVRKELLLKRNASQPTRYPNAGSIFKNPEGTFAAKLIQEAGLKGFRIGAAEVSDLHANFIIGGPGATSTDVLAIINHVRKTVYSRFGIVLELEIKLVGFPQNAVEPIEQMPLMGGNHAA